MLPYGPYDAPLSLPNTGAHYACGPNKLSPLSRSRHEGDTQVHVGSDGAAMCLRLINPLFEILLISKNSEKNPEISRKIVNLKKFITSFLKLFA